MLVGGTCQDKAVAGCESRSKNSAAQRLAAEANAVMKEATKDLEEKTDRARRSMASARIELGRRCQKVLAYEIDFHQHHALAASGVHGIGPCRKIEEEGGVLAVGWEIESTDLLHRGGE